MSISSIHLELIMKVDGTPYYNVCDRRGSVRQVINGTTGKVERQYHYYPFGALFGESSATVLQGTGAHSRHRFEGKERVACANLDFLDFPARPYDPLLLQFWTDDPLCEKYPRLGPKLYCGGNPIGNTDPTGMVILAHGEDTQIMIKNTLPKDSHKYIVFGNNGILNNDILSCYPNLENSTNYMSLYTMSSSEYIFEVNLIDFLYYFDENNSFDFEYLQTIDIDSDTSSEGMYLRTGESGWVGHISFPGKDRKYNSTNNNIQITIHKDLSPEGEAQAFSHEAYGHGYLYVKTDGDKYLSMHQREGMIEKNWILYNLINQAINETIKNMSK